MCESVNRKVFRLFLNCTVDFSARIWRGKAFHSFGPDTEKARSPSLPILFGISSLFDLSLLKRCTKFLISEGAVPITHL